MKSLIILFLFSCVAATVLAQVDSTSLLSKATSELKNHNLTVSSLLTDKTYSSLHPLTTFREIIRKNAAPDILSISTNDEPGKKIKVFATVRNKDGEPIAGALVYLYQTDSRGWYAAEAPHVTMNEGDFRHARLFGYVRTDRNGKVELHTVKPAGYPQSDLPAHIHVHITADGYRPYGTEFLFRDDERLKGEILNRAVVDGGMIGIPEKTSAPFEQQFSYDIRLIKQ